jgi:hypothetical protein
VGYAGGVGRLARRRTLRETTAPPHSWGPRSGRGDSGGIARGGMVEQWGTHRPRYDREVPTRPVALLPRIAAERGPVGPLLSRFGPPAGPSADRRAPGGAPCPGEWNLDSTQSMSKGHLPMGVLRPLQERIRHLVHHVDLRESREGSAVPTRRATPHFPAGKIPASTPIAWGTMGLRNSAIRVREPDRWMPSSPEWVGFREPYRGGALHGRGWSSRRDTRADRRREWERSFGLAPHATPYVPREGSDRWGLRTSERQRGFRLLSPGKRAPARVPYGRNGSGRMH